MGQITRVGPYSQAAYNFTIAGDKPTADEEQRIDARIRAGENQWTDYVRKNYGDEAASDVMDGEGEGVLNYANEIFKGIGRGAVQVFEDAALGTAVPAGEGTENKLREGILGVTNWAQNKMAPDIGMDQTLGGQFGEGLGSFAGLLGATYLMPPAGLYLAAAGGAGRESERARAAGATEGERTESAMWGTGIGLTNLIPMAPILSPMIRKIGLPAAKGIYGHVMRVLAEGTYEGLQETTEQVLSNLTAQGIYNPEQDTFEGVPGSAGMGFSVGSFIQAVIEAAAIKGQNGRTSKPGGDETPEGPEGDVPVFRQGEVGVAEPQGFEPEGESVPWPTMDQPLSTSATLSELDTPDISPATTSMEQVETGPIGIKKPEDIADFVPWGAETAPVGLVDTPSRQQTAPAQAEIDKIVRETSKLPPTSLAGYFAKNDERMKFPAGTTKKLYRKAQAPTQGDVERQAAEVEAAVKETVKDGSRRAESKKITAEAEATDKIVAEIQQTKDAMDAEAKVTAAEEAVTQGAIDEVAGKVDDLQGGIADIGGPQNVSGETTLPAGDTTGPITTDLLDEIGVPKGSDAYKAVQSGQPEDVVRKRLTSYAERVKNTKPEVGGRVIDLLEGRDTGAGAGGAGAGPASGGRPAATTGGGATGDSGPGRVGEPEPSGLAGAESDVARTEDGTQEQPAAVKVDENTSWLRSGIADIEGQKTEEGLPPHEKRPNPPPVQQKLKPVEPAPQAEPSTDTDELTAQARAWMFAGQAEAMTAFLEIRNTIVPQEVRDIARQNHAEMDDVPNLMTREDLEKITDILRRPKHWDMNRQPTRTGRVSKEEWAAGRYFLRHENPTEALVMMAHDRTLGVFEGGSSDTAITSQLKQFLTLEGSNAEKLAKKMLGRDYVRPEGASLDSPEVQYHMYTGGELAAQAIEWVKANLSPAAKEFLAKEQRKVRADLQREAAYYARTRRKQKKRTWQDLQKQAEDNKKAEARAKEDEFFRNTRSIEQAIADVALNTTMERSKGVTLAGDPTLKMLKRAFNVDQSSSLFGKVHPSVSGALKAGNAERALFNLAITTDSPFIREVALKLRPFMGKTKVFVESPGDPGYDKYLAERRLADGSLQELAVGVYRVEVEGRDPDPVYGNSVIFDREYMNPHSILHEFAHVATLRVLNDPSNPVTKQVKHLYDDMRPFIQNEYGDLNVVEFVSEAISNKKFRGKLAWQRGIAGRPETALQQLWNAITNFFRSITGRRMKTPESPLEEFDKMADKMLDQPIAYVPLDGNIIKYVRDGDNGVTFAKLDIGAMPKPVEFGLNHAKHVASIVMDGGTGDVMTNVTMGMVPLFNLADMAKGLFGDLPRRLLNASNNMSAELQELHKQLDHTLKGPSDWMKNLARDSVHNFNDVLFHSTRHRIDPGKPRSTYLGNADALRAYDAIQPAWRRLQKDGGEKHFYAMNNSFKMLLGKTKDAFEARIAALEPNKKQAASIQEALVKKVFTDNQMDIYSPLVRQGKYWYNYTADDPRTGMPTRYYEKFATKHEKNLAIKEVREVAKNLKDEHEFVDTKNLYTTGKQAPPAGFVRDIMEILDKSNAGPGAKQEVLDLVLDMAPEQSLIQSMRERKNEGMGQAGFKGDITPSTLRRNPRYDAVHHTRQKASSIARQLTRIKYGTIAQKVREEINEAWSIGQASSDPKFQTRYAEAIYKELDLRAAKLTGMNRAAWSRAGTGFLFFNTLGFNISSVAVNMFNLPIQVLGWTAGEYGLKDSAAAMGRATKLIAASGTEHEATRVSDKLDADGNPIIITERVEGGWAEQSLQNYDFEAKQNAPIRHFKWLVEAGRRANMFNRSLVFEMAEIDETISTSGMGSRWEKARSFSALPFHHSERYTRETTMITVFDLEMRKWLNGRDPQKVPEDKLEAAARAAADKAIYAAEITNGSVAATSAPRWLQTDVGSILGLYKRFALAQMGLQMTMWNRALRGATKEERRIALAQLGYVYGLLASIGGVAGIPMYGAIADLWDLFMADDEDERFDTVVRTTFGELGFKGLANYVTGKEIASRISLNDMFYREPLQDLPIWAEVIAGGSGPAGGMVMNYTRVGELLNEGEYYRAFEAVLPAAFKNVAKARRYWVEGEAKTMRGDPIIGDIGTGEIIGQFFGFAPARYVKQLELNSQYKRIDKAIAERRSKLMKKYYIALRERNFLEAREQLAEMREFNRDNPQYPIKPENLERSVKQHEDTSSRMIGGVTYNKANAARIQRMISEWDKSSSLFG